MWHVSVAHSERKTRRRMALKILRGLGDSALGEWIEDNAIAYHVKRRLTAGEEARTGGVIDLRGTIEGDDIMRGFLASVSMHPQYSVIENAVKDEIAAAI